jgi:methylated-DNA-[protein]-cysteine S-methyltransferase
MTKKISAFIYWSLLSNEGWNMHVAATDEGLCYVGSQNQPLDELKQWVKARYPGSSLIRDDEKLRPYMAELAQYLQGTLGRFTLPIIFRGTPFQEAVWHALCDIPYGQTKSYSDIAQHIQKPTSVRAVGAAIGANPILITVPCHRVIGKNGALTGYRGGIEMKTKLLQLEQDGLRLEGGLQYG